MNMQLIACDKDSSAGYSKTVQFSNADELSEVIKEFDKEVPFARWYLDYTTDDEQAEELMEQWEKA